jgi:hypothetical protein
MNMRNALRLSLVVPAALTTLTAFSPTGYAATTTAKFHPTMTTKTVSLNGKVVSQPKGFAYDNTTYLPVYYVMHALDSIHITSSWDGTKKEWKLTVPSTATVDYSNLNVGTGDISIYINNKLVKKINGIVYTDPASGIPTMYLPIWYAMGVFERMGITPSWDGTHWGMTQNSTETPQSPPASQGPQDTNPQASSIPGAVSKETLVKDLTTLLNVSKTAPTQSAYDDVPLSNPDAAAITTAVNQHWISPVSSTHFGAGDVVTLHDAEQFYWNYLNIQQGQYQPGQTVDQWAAFIGLEDNVHHTQYLMVTDEQQFLKNLSALLKGYIQSGNTYHVRYTPKDEYTATFAGAKSSSGGTFFPSTSDIQTAITNTYHFFNGITVQQQGNSLLTTVPLPADGTWFAYATTTNDIQYSLDNGATWKSAPYLDSTTFRVRPSQVLLKVPSNDGVTISFNKLMPTFQGSTVLGMVNIFMDPSLGLQVQRMSF